MERHLFRRGPGKLPHLQKSSIKKKKKEITNGSNDFLSGKPTETTYVFAENAIENHRRKLNANTHIPDLRTIYMVGDNPMSDILGANVANETSYMAWRSVLVESGVYMAGTVPEHQPTAIKADVWEAVDWIMQQELGKDVIAEACELIRVASKELVGESLR